MTLKIAYMQFKIAYMQFLMFINTLSIIVIFTLSDASNVVWSIGILFVSLSASLLLFCKQVRT